MVYQQCKRMLGLGDYYDYMGQQRLSKCISDGIAGLTNAGASDSWVEKLSKDGKSGECWLCSSPSDECQEIGGIIYGSNTSLKWRTHKGTGCIPDWPIRRS